MGEDFPDPPPIFEDAKWYCVHLDVFQGPGPPTGCGMPWIGDIYCCETGGWINQWINDGDECRDGWELCIATGFSAQRLLDWTGPYDTDVECQAACFPW